MKKLGTTLVAILLAAGLPLTAAADTIAYSPTAGGLVESRDVTFGFQFEPAEAITVTAIGHYDHADDGLVASHQVAIWNLDGTVVAQTTIPAGTVGALQGQYRFIDLPEPAVLATGQTYLIGIQTQKSEHYPWQMPYNFAPEIIPRSGVLQGTGSGLIFPDTSAGSHSRAPVNFLFSGAAPPAWLEEFSGQNPPGEDIALRALATQVSRAYNGYASRAVDGDRNGNWGGNSVTHTNPGTDPWLQIDLGLTSTLEHLVLFNRTDCCADRLRNVKVSVSDDPSFSTVLWEVENEGVFAGPSYQGTFPAGTEARYLRISTHNPDQARALSLAAVEIYGQRPDVGPAGLQNVAQGKPASQVSTAYNAPAERAVDGERNGFFFVANSVTHTTAGVDNWWQVDLQERYDITRINVFNRTDCCADRLNDFRVQVSDDATFSAVSWEQEVSTGGFGALWHLIDVQPGEAVGRYVRVQRTGAESQALSLAEVEVYGDPAPPAYQGAESFTTPGTHTFTVEQDATVRITAAGGDGGGSFGNGRPGGAGANMVADFALSAGDQLSIFVGNSGEIGQVDSRAGGGGGGGSAVVRNGSSVLIAAGAGGGGGRGLPGGGGRASTDSVAGGGAAGGNNGGAGGGGFDAAGADVTVDPVATGGGGGTLSGPGAGGLGHNPQHAQGGDGGDGFGGGGGSHKQGGGGGGGYQGGAGSPANMEASQGGDSFVDPSGTVVSATAGGDGAGAGNHGSVALECQ